jgi:ABC-type multidrug transport system fused ATPase/permease subunit
VLRDVSFTVRPKTTAALVGRSGSGKSTVVKLLLRQSDPKSGHVLVDETPVSGYSLKELRSKIAVVSQDVELFNESVAANIAYGAPKASRAAVIKAAKMAHAHDFIMALPKKYDTVIGERGVKLSGGQKQRLAIARALLRDPKVLILDEATSSLDAESEARIHDAITGLSGKITLIIIAHRFSTIERADHVILLERGRVAESGTHEELLRKEGIFAKLRRLQKLE